MQKLLLGVFVVLLVVIIAQVVYLLPGLNLQSGNLKNTTQQTINGNGSSTTNVEHDPLQAINEFNLNALRAHKTGLLVSSIVENTTKGVIAEIDTNPQTNVVTGTLGQSQYEYRLKIVLRGELDDEVITTFYFRKSDLANLTIFENISGTERPIEKEGLEVGDTITIIEKVDLKKDWEDSYLSYKIVKN